MLALIAVAIGMGISSRFMHKNVEMRSALLYPQAMELPEFSLQTAAGKTLQRSDLEDQWTLLFFGFTNCPDVCPDTLVVLAEVRKRLESSGAAALPQVLFITLDPERDDAQALAEYTRWFHPEFIGASTDPDTLNTLTQRLGIYHARVDLDDADDGFYTLDHSASVLIVNPQAQLIGRFGPPLDAQNLTADLFNLVR